MTPFGVPVVPEEKVNRLGESGDAGGQMVGKQFRRQLDHHHHGEFTAQARHASIFDITAELKQSFCNGGHNSRTVLTKGGEHDVAIHVHTSRTMDGF